MILYRNLIEKLYQWTGRSARKPLLILGAKHAGKTTLIKILSKKFDQFIHLNLSEWSDRRIFEQGHSPSELMDALFFLKDCSLERKRTLILLGEIQNSTAAMDALVSMSARFNNLFFVSTASFISPGIEQWINDPTSPVEMMPLHPCSFSEYLRSIEDQPVIDAYHETPVPTSFYSKLLSHFHHYLLIGGMPSVLGRFCEDKHLSATKPLYEEILFIWNESIQKEFSGKKGELLRFTLQNAFPFAATRIKFHHFGNSGYRSREMGEAFRILEKFQFLKLQYPSTSSTLPLLPNRKKSPRLQLLDTGMVNYFSGIQKQLFQSDDMNALFHGQIARQAAGQELMTASIAGSDALGIWVREKPQSMAEVDFVLSYNGMLIPVEVKSGESGSLRSLHQFVDRAPHPYAVRLYAGDLTIRQTQTISGRRYYLLSLPYFLAGRIIPHLEGFIKYVNSFPSPVNQLSR